MNLLSDLISIFDGLNIPVETGKFSDIPPNEYAVLVPISDEFELYADDYPAVDVHSVRISLFTKGNYIKLKNRVLKAVLNAGITVTERIYLGFEQDTVYHHYSIDVEKAHDVDFETEE